MNDGVNASGWTNSEYALAPRPRLPEYALEYASDLKTFAAIRLSHPILTHLLANGIYSIPDQSDVAPWIRMQKKHSPCPSERDSPTAGLHLTDLTPENIPDDFAFFEDGEPFLMTNDEEDGERILIF